MGFRKSSGITEAGRIKYLKRFISLSFLNIWDILLTFYFVSFKKLTEEINPIMKVLLDYDPIVFILLKLVIITILVLFISKYSILDKWANMGYFILLFSYIGIGITHLIGLIVYLFT